MTRKQILIFTIASLFCTLLVYRPLQRTIMGTTEPSGVPEEVLFTAHVAPIIHAHCITCHRNAGPAPFELLSYTDVMRKKRTIVKVIHEGVMPPWPADPNYSRFVGENVLSDIEKQTIERWAEQGYRKGPDAKMPDIPEFSPFSTIGEPDLVLFMDSIEVKGNNRDRFLVVKVPGELEQDRDVRAIEFVPGKHRIVHHLNGHVLNYDPAGKHNVFDGDRIAEVELPADEYLDAFNALKLNHDDASYPRVVHSAVNYLPGVTGTLYPDGIGGFRLSRKFVILANDLHYAPIPANRTDRSHFNIFFAEQPPQRPTHELMLGTNGLSPIRPALDIPPDTLIRVHTRFRLTDTISILTINPHMHLLGTDFIAYALKPDGDTIPLIRIPRWDFRWQYFYTFLKVCVVPAGSVIVAEGGFDNTSANPHNPFTPPQRIRERQDRNGAGMRTTDEMFQFIITYMDYQSGDEQISLSRNGK